MTKKLLSISDLSILLPTGADRQYAVQDIDLELNASETVCVVGESGSGKSTLLSLICGTIIPQSGTVHVAGKDMAKLSSAKRDQFRAEKIGLIFQQFNLLPFASVMDNILLPLRFAPKRKGRVKNATEQAKQLCKYLGLPDDVLDAKASQLSVGQQQRVAAARALIG